jgi:hypothetical protein
MSSVEYDERVKILDKMTRESPSKLGNSETFDMEVKLSYSKNNVSLPY